MNWSPPPGFNLPEFIRPIPMSVDHGHSEGLLHTCLDKTGKFTDSPTVSFGGWISDAYKWSKFTQDWYKLREDFPGISSIHMKVLMRPVSERSYQGHTFTVSKPRADLINRYIEIVSRWTLEVVGYAVDCDAFRKVLSEKSRRRIGGDAHIFVFRRIMKHIVDRLNFLDWPYATGLLFDDNEEYGRECHSLYNKARNHHPDWKKKFGSICFVDDELYPPMQAADVLAWLIRRGLDNKQAVQHKAWLDQLIFHKHLTDHLYDEGSLRELEQKLQEYPERS